MRFTQRVLLLLAMLLVIILLPKSNSSLDRVERSLLDSFRTNQDNLTALRFENIDFNVIIRSKSSFLSSLSKARLDLANPDINEALDMTEQQVDSLENMVKQSLQVYRDVLETSQTNLTASIDIRKQTGKIVDEFHNAIVKAKGDIKIMDQQEKNKEKLDEAIKANGSKQNVVNNLLKGVEDVADLLENSNKQKDAFAEETQKEGAQLETVVKISDESETESSPASGSLNGTPSNVKPSSPSDQGWVSFFGRFGQSVKGTLPRLIDPDGNTYTLSKSSDLTAYFEDNYLIEDLMQLILCCFICSLFFYLIRLPAFFGYILAGILLGPLGFNRIRSHIQIESLAAYLGVLFLMFQLGLEFSIAKVGKVLRVSFIGSIIPLVVITSSFIVIGLWLPFTYPEILVVSGATSLSSTMVVLKCLKPEEIESTVGRSILGILIAQDILLGVLLALLPALQSTGWERVTIIGKTAAYLIGFAASCFLFKSLVQRIWVKTNHKEMALMASVATAVLMAEITNLLGLSREIGVFGAGIILQAQSDGFIHGIEGLKDLWSALFFSSIGLHLYPTFLIKEGLLLLGLTFGVVTFKIVVLWCCLWVSLKSKAKVVAVALSQISEFGFVLAGKAKKLGLLSREVYYLLLGTTGLSLIVAPFLWKLVHGSIADTGYSAVGTGNGGGNGNQSGSDMVSILPVSRPSSRRALLAKDEEEEDKVQ